LSGSADSIAANIAEGFGRYSKKDKAKFTGLVWHHWKNRAIG
jgi:four helix bundle protein